MQNKLHSDATNEIISIGNLMVKVMSHCQFVKDGAGHVPRWVTVPLLTFISRDLRYADMQLKVLNFRSTTRCFQLISCVVLINYWWSTSIATSSCGSSCFASYRRWTTFLRSYFTTQRCRPSVVDYDADFLCVISPFAQGLRLAAGVVE